MPVGQHVIPFLIFYFIFILLLITILPYLSNYISAEININIPDSFTTPPTDIWEILIYLWDSTAFLFSMIIVNPFGSWSILAWFWLALSSVFIYILIVDVIVPILDLIPFT